MHVAIDARLYGTFHRGIGRYVTELVRALAELDGVNRYTLLVQPANQEQPRNLPANFRTLAAPWRAYAAAEQVQLPRLLWRLRPDLVHVPHFNVPLAISLPFVATIHDLITYEFPTERASTLPMPLYRVKLAAAYLVFRRAVCGAEKVITVSHDVAQKLGQRFPCSRGKTVVTHLAPGTPAAATSLALPPRYVLAVGSAYPHKNLERLVMAVHDVRRSEPALRLIIAGRRDAFMDHLTGWVAAQGYGATVRFWGAASEGDLAALYTGAAAYVLPSLAEGFGLGGLEALRYGTPVVAADLPVLREVLGPCAAYADPVSVPALTLALQDVLRDTATRARLLAGAQELLAGYSWRAAAARTLETYRSAVARTASPR